MPTGKQSSRLTSLEKPINTYKAPPFSMFYEPQAVLEAWHKKHNPNCEFMPKAFDEFYSDLID
ncbi:protein of unknown function, might belong to DeoR family transcriptional regulator [Shewanella benthica]|uniref:Uncharacterized protein n=1 Tax=Shewanella benthica TaxID=43661 RepID=A0A330LYU1_9GAMM|nr:hypothetical protein [Shewanella benthica]SQH75529.1 protein of unknown function, might belong to DeoR family transcriptional regulator [Shewanella benthica]